METHISMDNPQAAGPSARVEGMVPMAALSEEAFAEIVMQTLVVVPYRADEGVNPGVCNHFGMWGRIGLKYATLKDPHGGFIEIIRGHAERVFLDMADQDPRLKYLVFVDNDQGIEWDTPLKLVRHGLPVVSGVVCGYNAERGIFACFTSYDEKNVPRFPSYRFTKSFPGKGLKKVHQCGTGLVAIRRDVFETIIERGEQSFVVPEKLRIDAYRVGHIKQGEDFSFCDRVRAAGFDIHVDFSIRAIHYKNIGIAWPEELIDDDLDAKDWDVSTLDFRGLRDLV